MTKFIKPDVSCNCCGSQSVTVLFPAGVAQEHQIVRCAQCGLMYASPQLVQYGIPKSEIDSGSDRLPDYSEADYQRITREVGWKRRVTKEEGQIDDYQDTFEFLDQKFPSRGKVLEIGTGFGCLLQELTRRGWESVGIDSDGGVVRYARERGVNVIHGFFESTSFSEAEFDVVVMNHVIEHVYDPHSLLKEIHRVLKPNGYLVVETPRYDSLAFKLLGKRERSLSHNGHIFFFTGATLSKLSELAGFNVTRIDTVGRTLTLDRLTWNLGVISKSQQVRGLLDRFSQWTRLDKVKIKLNMGDMMRVYLHKDPAPAPSEEGF